MPPLLHTVEGKLTALQYLERPDQGSVDGRLVPPIDPDAREKRWGYWFTHNVVPLAAALTGNFNTANMLVLQQATEGVALAKLRARAEKDDQISTWSLGNALDSKTYVSNNASVTVGKNSKIIAAKLPVEIEIDGTSYRGFLGGQCFQVGDNVAAVVDKSGRLFALSSPDRRYTVMNPSCGENGFAALARSTWFAWKWLFIGINCLMLPVLLIALGTSQSGFSDLIVDVIFFIGMPIIVGVMLVLIIWGRLSWSDWHPAWRTSAIFHALGRPDLCKHYFMNGIDAERKGLIRDGDIGHIYYLEDMYDASTEKG
ncbi:hypothetical protein [Robbsia andropogonis]|uniref:hypothetical protein n=1 Tax=Robbsia andropogonis TaxID=28092 RepID=UPI00209D47F0|nr:hypothetical protein [Robbsia andropogonis]MCP1121237.1 hypothetical protein [Robbsia andropogonis]MCP1131010.1 hypothetical protein [Robbsia andropogonis]